MGGVTLGITYGRRDLANTPQIYVQNLVLEANQANEVDGKTWLIRPGTAQFDAPGGVGVRGLYQGSGASPKQFYIVKGTHLYTESQFGDTSTLIGAIPGVQYCQFAESPDVLLILGDGVVYKWNGTTLITVAMPGGVQVGWIAYTGGYFLLGQAFSQIVFFMFPTDNTPNALNFFSIETHANNTVRAMLLADQTYFYTTGNCEAWQPSGDQNLPFNRIVGAGFERGLVAKNAICKADNTIFWVGDDLVVYRLNTVPVRVSDNSVEERLRVAFDSYGVGNQLPVFPMWPLLLDGHAYVVLTIDGQGTWAYDISTGSWLNWCDSGAVTWRAQMGLSLNGFIALAGNLTDASLYRVSAEIVDQGGIPWKLTGGVPISGNAKRLDDTVLFVNAGYGGSLSVPVAVDLELSNDQGATFTDPILAIGGEPGDYSANPLWQMLGDMRQPQCVFRFSGVALGPFRISYCRYNEFSG